MICRGGRLGNQIKHAKNTFSQSCFSQHLANAGLVKIIKITEDHNDTSKGFSPASVTFHRTEIVLSQSRWSCPTKTTDHSALRHWRNTHGKLMSPAPQPDSLDFCSLTATDSDSEGPQSTVSMRRTQSVGEALLRAHRSRVFQRQYDG